MTTLVLGVHVRLGMIRSALLSGPWRAPSIVALETADLASEPCAWPHRSSVGSPVAAAEAAVARARRPARRRTDAAIAAALAPGAPSGAVAAVVLGTKHGRLSDMVTSTSTRRRAEDADEHLLATLVEGSARRAGLAVDTPAGADVLRRAQSDLGLSGQTGSAVGASAAAAFDGGIDPHHHMALLAGWIALIDHA